MVNVDNTVDMMASIVREELAATGTLTPGALAVAIAPAYHEVVAEVRAEIRDRELLRAGLSDGRVQIVRVTA